MVWIESHSELGAHPKLKRLARILEVSPAQAVGHLHYFWWWVMIYAPDGDLNGFDESDIAEGAAWESDPGTFVDALKNAGFMDAGLVHDWAEYGEKLHLRRLANAERMRRKREQSERVQSTCETRAAHESSTCETRAALQDRTGQDRTGQDQACMPEPPAADSSLAVFEYFKEKILPHARVWDPKKIRARLKVFSEDELRRAIDHFSEDWWEMKNNGKRGCDWFFHSDRRIEGFLNMVPRPEEERSNGKHRADSGLFEVSAECLEYAREIEDESRARARGEIE